MILIRKSSQSMSNRVHESITQSGAALGHLVNAMWSIIHYYWVSGWLGELVAAVIKVIDKFADDNEIIEQALSFFGNWLLQSPQ